MASSLSTWQRKDVGLRSNLRTPLAEAELIMPRYIDRAILSKTLNAECDDTRICVPPPLSIPCDGRKWCAIRRHILQKIV